MSDPHVVRTLTVFEFSDGTYDTVIHTMASREAPMRLIVSGQPHTVQGTVDVFMQMDKPPRKRPTRVDQDQYLELLHKIGAASLPTIAEALGVSVGTARRKVDGLVEQRKLEKIERSPELLPVYRIPMSIGPRT